MSNNSVNNTTNSTSSQQPIFRRLQSHDDSNKDDITIEEKYPDAIYQVTYKTIYNKSIHSSDSNLSQNCKSANSANSSNFLVYSKIRIKQLKFATIQKLIDHFTNENGELESNITNTFLSTYRTFTSITNVLDLLFRKYEIIFPASLEMTEESRLTYIRSFRSIITTWIDTYSEDFDEPPAYSSLGKIREFCLKSIPTESSELVRHIDKNLKEFYAKNNIKEKGESAKSRPIGGRPVHRVQSQHNVHPRSTSNDSTLNYRFVFEHMDAYIDASSATKYSVTPPLKNVPYHPIAINTRFKEVDERYVAEQLTFIDKELFKKVIAYHCLGSVWSARHRADLPSISNFIEQFNVVTFLVQGTVLENIEMSATKRAKIIEKWIKIAQWCRNYKNFSSLNAIVQGLNTQGVSRLQKTWNEISIDYKTQFNDLIELFSQENNQQLFRETLMKEGTAKFADLNCGINATLSRKAKEKLMKQRFKQNEPLGTVPFLGTFLKDLEYIHAQNPTKNENGLVNFAKKRKEFEIIAQIRLLQRAAHFYKIEEDLNFKLWLNSLPSINVDSSYDLSYQIEPQSESIESSQSSAQMKLSRTSSNGSSSDQYFHSPHTPTGSHTSSTLGSQNNLNNSNGSNMSSSPTTLTGNCLSKPLLIVKVNIELLNNSQIIDNSDVSAANNVKYKKISIKDSDRTKEIKRLILSKFQMDIEKADKFHLFQKFSDGQDELLIKDNCNVFYAVKNVDELQFILRERDHNNNNTTGGNFTGNSLSANGNANSNNRFMASPNALAKKYHQFAATISKATNLVNCNSAQNHGFANPTNVNGTNTNALLPPPAPNHKRRSSWQLKSDK